MFIVLEGIDGCGKSTQARLLYKWLIKEGFEVFLTAEPTDNMIGSCLKGILSSGEEVDPHALALLFTSDRYEHIKKEIEPALQSRKIVILERYYHSTVAYQAAQGVDRQWLIDLNSFAVDMKPDITFFFDIGSDVAIPKIQEKDREFRELIERSRQKVDDARKHYLNNRKAMYGKLNQKKAVEELMESYKRFELAKGDYEREKSKYLKFEKFERPTTLESETSKYNIFLEKVRENYLLFNDVNKVDGTKPIDLVFTDIQKAVKERLRL